MFSTKNLYIFLLVPLMLGASSAQSDSYSIKVLVGQEMLAILPFVAAQRRSTFYEYPYLCDETIEEEDAYLASFLKLSYSAIAIAYQGQEPVGFLTGAAFTDYNLNGSVDLFKKAGLNPEKYYYFPEVIVLSEHRGNRLAERLFETLENYAKSCNYTAGCFVTEGYDKHPLKPKNHRSLQPLWQRIGYTKSSIILNFAWSTRQLDGSSKEEEHPLVYWLKDFTINRETNGLQAHRQNEARHGLKAVVSREILRSQPYFVPES